MDTAKPFEAVAMRLMAGDGISAWEIAEAIEECVNAERERCAKIAADHKGAATKRRLARGMKLGSLPHHAQDEIVAEERGEDIAAEMIATAIRTKTG